MKWPGDFINKIICGDCLEVMKEMPNESVDMIMTSPPYYGLRDYGFEQIFGGKKNCKHEWEGKLEHNIREKTKHGKSRTTDRFYGEPSRKFNANIQRHQSNIYCSKCQAWKGQLGLEATPEMYIEHLIDIFNEAKRVLKKKGTLWLNMGDTYGGPGQLKNYAKCLLMIPERLAWSLIQNGWKLRNKIIWFKPNSMPSSTKDRFSNRWEYLFYFVKSQENYFDLDAIREPHHLDSIARKKRGVGPDHKYANKPGYGGGGGLNKPRLSLKDKRKGLVVPGQLPHGIHRKRHSGYFGENGDYLVNPLGKNPGDIIEVGVETRTMGAIIGSGGGVKVPGGKGWTGHPKGGGAACEKDPRWCPPEGKNPGDFQEISTQPFPEAHFAVFPEKLCDKPIKAGCPEGGIVLDPFTGAGTVLYVAKQLRRRFIGIDIKKEYCDLCEKRLAQGVLYGEVNAKNKD